MTKIDFEKMEKIKKKLMTQNANMCIGIKFESFFQLSSIKKDRQTALLVIKIDNAKITNLLIEKWLALDHILHKYIRYNLACKVKQSFKYYEYSHVLVYY